MTACSWILEPLVAFVEMALELVFPVYLTAVETCGLAVDAPVRKNWSCM